MAIRLQFGRSRSIRRICVLVVISIACCASISAVIAAALRATAARASSASIVNTASKFKCPCCNFVEKANRLSVRASFLFASPNCGRNCGYRYGRSIRVFRI
jgi:hypothetical protein